MVSPNPNPSPSPLGTFETPRGAGEGPDPEKRTEYVRPPLLAAGLSATTALVLFAAALTKANGWLTAVGALPTLTIGWGSPLFVLQNVGLWRLIGAVHPALHAPSGLFMGAALFTAFAAVMLAFGIRRIPEKLEQRSEAAKAPLYPRLANYRDFYWSTLAAYGFGIFFAELAMVLLQTLLAGDVSFSGAVTESTRGLSMSPVAALAIAGAVGVTIVFAAGFLGALRARRPSVPEATIGILYFGLPIPIFLTLVSSVPDLTIQFGYSLREVIYVASLIGRPELSFWLAFAGLVLFMVLGITSSFVLNGSGRFDARTGTELFIAGRHVSIFRPRLLLGALTVLMLGIIPPLIVYFILAAAESTVEKTRIRQLGLRDPLDASKALHAEKQREQTPTSMMTSLSVGGVGVGVMALIIVLSVMSGFEEDLQKKILGTNAHVVVMKYSDDFSEYEDTAKQVHRVQGVVGVTPFILNQVMVASEGSMDGSIIKGIDPATVGEVTDLPNNILPAGTDEGRAKLKLLDHPEEIMVPKLAPKGGAAIDGDPADGKLFKPTEDDDLARDPIIGEIGKKKEETTKPAVLPGIILGKELAANLKVIEGDRINVVTPISEELGPQGPMPKSRPFRVAGIFYSGMYEYDSKMVYISLKEARTFFKIKGASGLELKVNDIDDARRIGKTVLKALGGYPYRSKDWGEMNKNLFSALRLEKLVMGIILSIIVIVAAGLIVATVIMLVLEKRKEIAVLKALGVSDGGILKIFLAEGLQIGLAGSLLGLAAGLAWCVFIERVGIKLDPEVYYIPSLPVKVEPLQTAVPVVIAVLVSFLASVYPALKASRVEPVEGLKAE
ncbi:MAG: FtsX-like permease family protein [Myxococcaceae bacterium]